MAANVCPVWLRPACRSVSALLAAVTLAVAGPAGAQPRQFVPGSWHALDELPPGRLRLEIQQLPPEARENARRWLGSFHFTDADMPSLHADASGGICYACGFPLPADQPAAAPTADPPPVAFATVPVNPFPAHLVFHSRPGSPNVLFIEFSGMTVTNSEWNTTLGRTEVPALPFSTDSDPSTFNDGEQAAIKRIWQRMSEDYAPFDIDVTTERPASFNNRTAIALITRNTDANGAPNPYSDAGGVAYVNVFNTANSGGYARYRPAWVYHNNLANDESYIGEAASHEVGHNMGLSHDGQLGGIEYYGGHGSGDISWGPIMGTGYGRNVTQWSRGEYYMADNGQDDLATIAGKTTYRPDDHGNTPGTATALAVDGGTNIASTTPQNDPACTNTANKGVLAGGTDVDVFSFVAGSGPVLLSVNPWIMPSGYRGGNLDLLIELFNDSGVRLVTNNPALQTTASIQTNMVEGRYYLHVRSSGAGSPLDSPPTGYTVYGSAGQFFISGTVTKPSGFAAPPAAELLAADLTDAGQTSKQFTVTYSDDVAVDVATIGSGDIRVTGPSGYDRPAQFVSLDAGGNGTPRAATYAAAPAGGGAWSAADNGAYSVFVRSNEVADTDGLFVPPALLGQFNVAVPVVVYSADMSADPGWTLDPLWEYGPPAYASAGPASGFTGTNIVGYNLDGDYQNSLTARYATTPPVNAAGSTSLTLRFRRWLVLRKNDTAAIQVSTNGTDWIEVWSNGGPAVGDSAWTMVQYSLPSAVAGSHSLRLRWSIESGPSQSDIGWNIDDVELFGDGSLDTSPPVPALSVADLTVPGSPSHSCSVTYSDATGVRLSSLDSADLLVTGPSGYSNLAEFAGADLGTDGSPLTGVYSIPAPAGVWDASANGAYDIVLLGGAVEDTLNNPIPSTSLGGFTVAIRTAALAISANDPAWGSVSPSSGIYTAGMPIELIATPALYFRFSGWGGDLSGTNNPLVLVLNSNLNALAIFAEVLTTNHPTPLRWLAGHGWTNDFENAVNLAGLNGYPLWQSYIAGLSPTNPASRLVLSAGLAEGASGLVLEWDSVTGRVYSIWSGTNLIPGLSPMPGATGLPWTVRSFTTSTDSATFQFFRLAVEKP